MKLTYQTMFDFRQASRNIIYGGSAISDKYLEVLDRIKKEVGEIMEFEDACSMCQLGFFMTNVNLESNESMHFYDGRIYYEDGACLSTSGLIDHPLQWMKTGWKIKASPHRIDFGKLAEMHEKSKVKSLTNSYEECIIR